jgi:uncharacterized protein (DUF1330 family)
MKTYIATGLALIAGFGLGAVSVEGLHAQGKPPVYVVAEINVSNVERYMKDYQPKAGELVKKNGGRLLAAANVKGLEGTPPTRVAIQQWESMDQVNKWYNSPEYKENRKIGDKYAKFRLYAVEGR